jgi:hypothetical protein
LDVSYADSTGPEPDATLGLIGQATNRAQLTIADCSNCGGQSPPPVDFGVSGVPVQRNLALVNSGGATAQSISFSGLSAPFSITNDNCTGQMLGPNSSCSFTVTFSGASTASQQLSASYSDATGGLPATTRQIVGTGTTHSVLRISSCPQCGQQGTFDFGTHGTPSPNTFYVQNVGATGATGISVAGLNGTPFSVGQNTCTGTLAPNNSCQMVVTFTPTGNGPSNATLSLNFSDQGGGAQPAATQQLTGTSTSRALLYLTDCATCTQGFYQMPPPTDFGSSGIPVTRVVTVFNGGAVPTTAITVQQPAAPFSVTQNGCGAVLAANASCNLTVTFTPSVAPGTSMGTLSINASDASGALPVSSKPLTGTSINRALLTIADCNGCGQVMPGYPPFDFGTTGIGWTNQFSVQNAGALPTTALSVQALSAPFSASGCAGQLMPGDTCILSVTFTPTSNAFSQATLTVNYSDSGGALQPLTRAIQGTGLVGALLSISDNTGGPGGPTPPPYDFGTAGVMVKHRFTVFNGGSQDATAVVPTVGGPFAIAENDCATTLMKGNACSVVVSFAPQGTQFSSATLNVAYSDQSGAKSPATHGVQGTGTTGPFIILSDFLPGSDGVQPQVTGEPTYDFGTWGVTTSTSMWVANVGATATTDLGPAMAPGTGYTLNNLCPTALAPNATMACEVQVNFHPPTGSTATFPGTLAMKAGTQTVTRQFTGTATNRALLRVSEMSPVNCGEACGPYPFPNVLVGMTGPQYSFLITNTGALDANPVAITADDATHFIVTPSVAQPCGTTLTAGQTCTVNVAFHPTAATTYSARLNANYADTVSGGLNAFRSVTGTGN